MLQFFDLKNKIEKIKELIKTNKKTQYTKCTL